MADRSAARELGQDPEFEHNEREDSLEDSISHIPAAPHLRQVPPPPTIAVLATAPAPYSDPVFIAQIVRAVIETIPQLPVPTPQWHQQHRYRKLPLHHWIMWLH
jgi:hypothetical protein